MEVKVSRFGHHCPDWDEMYITEDDPEYEACCCDKDLIDKQRPTWDEIIKGTSNGS